MTSQSPGYPRKLERSDIRDGFDSGSRELDEWINRYALQDQRANSATTYVTCVKKLVVGFYSITVGAVAKGSAPTAIARSAPPEVPCILISRLAVDRSWQRQGVGAGLLRDALERSALLSNAVAARAVMIHARDSEARSFFMGQLDFQPSPLDDLQLMISMRDVQENFGVSPEQLMSNRTASTSESHSAKS